MHKVLKFKYHGNYGGPQYCGGTYDEKCDFDVPPSDRLDSMFRTHDLNYTKGNINGGDQMLLESLKSESGLKAKAAGYGFAVKSAVERLFSTRAIERKMTRLSPTNKQMHAINGNIKTRRALARNAQKSKTKQRALQPAPGGPSPFRVVPESVSLSVSVKTPNYFRMSSLPMHRDFGAGGIRVAGRQGFFPVTTTATDSQCFASGGGTATETSINSVLLNPDRLNGRIAAIATWYQRYAFRKVRLIYTPYVATSQTGALGIAYYNDAAATGFQTLSFSAIQDANPMCITPFREPCVIDIAYTGDLTWFTEVETANNPATRLTSQGLIAAFPSASSIGAVTQGTLYIEYVCDLYGPTSTYGFTLTCRSSAEYRMVQDVLNRYRASLSDDHKEETKSDISTHMICNHCKF